ncbi:MAG: hypothetical protein EWV76_20665 [Microcystis novacekii Mn_MB_F_20050700_S1]|uniref:Uncharacterized protein n=1 Tax=Microcystis novacekii Mn_MB_F_20050700_S1D TaxID=2486266 RepID=A0A552IYX3_9CHRO|nr:MAG: hypothetical protein EWV76_20665 [Microcystis novacekii Mn_MB_F_20050700_S1]TRU88689.1 MAG: hypothetical protein EWV54_10055 [Microcystis novacekii Mn_MB_F_20050700_S1D]
MNLPIQSQPVMRNVSTAAFSGGMEQSGVGCTLTCFGCSKLSGIAKSLCLAAAKLAGCSC